LSLEKHFIDSWLERESEREREREREATKGKGERTEGGGQLQAFLGIFFSFPHVAYVGVCGVIRAEGGTCMK